MKQGPDSAVIMRACAMTIRGFRKKSGYAQELLALESGIDRAYMSRLERGVHAPNLDTLFKLFPRLGITFRDFAAEMEANIRRVKHERKKPPPPPTAAVPDPSPDPTTLA